MSIVSISLDEESIASLDMIAESFKLKGRSDAVRMSIKSAVAELKEMDDYDGLVEGVLIIVHEHHDDAWISMIQHRNEELIRTQLHSHLADRKCLELMIVSGEGQRIRDMLREVHSANKASYIKLVRN
jgi:CopG family nickel-responsive transcriptional regulator